MVELARELNGVLDPLSDETFFLDVEMPAYERGLRDTRMFCDLVLSQEQVERGAKELALTRMFRSQWDLRSVGVQGLVRNWWIINSLEQSRGDILDAVARRLRISLRDFLNAGYGLLTLAGATNGLVQPSRAMVDAGAQENLNLDADSLDLVASKLSKSERQFHEWYVDGNALPEVYRKYHPHVLVSAPFLRQHENPVPRSQYLCPSPPHLVWNLQRAPFDFVREHANALPAADCKRLLTELGEHVSRYIRMLLVHVAGEANVVSLDDIFGDDDGPAPRHADYAVVAGQYVLVVESKTAIGSTAAKSVAAPQDYLQIWDRIASAYRQVATTIHEQAFRSDARFLDKTPIGLVSFDEVLCVEGAGLNRFAMDVGLVGQLRLCPTETVSLQELEDLLVRHGPERLGNIINRKWQMNHQGELLGPFVQRHREWHAASPHKGREHLADASTSLLARGGEKLMARLAAQDRAAVGAPS